ncbi:MULTISPECIES: hypothetical protein [unclassified Thalassospira]|nr:MULTISPECIES: hypothetical protein [unclassified Thalassospira]
MLRCVVPRITAKDYWLGISGVFGRKLRGPPHDFTEADNGC